MHFQYKVATTLTVLVLIAVVLQLVAVLSVPVTSSISLCTYDGYKFGVFGLCSVSTGTCSPIEIGYSRNTVDDLEGFSLPSNTRHSISTLLVVHPIATGFTFALLIMSILTHFKVFNRSLKFLLLMIFWCFLTFLLCLLSFLVDILLFIPHLDWGGWIVLASTVLVAISGTVTCIMRRTAASRNLYDYKKENNNVELYSMLPLKESYGYIRDTNDTSPSNEPSDSEHEDLENILDRTHDLLLYADDASTQPTDIVRNDSLYRGFNTNNNVIQNNTVLDPEEDAYYEYNPMQSTNVYTRTPKLNRRDSVLSLVRKPPPGRNSLPYPIDEPEIEEEISSSVPEIQQKAPYPQQEDLEEFEEQQDMRTPTIPRIATPVMGQEYVPQAVKVSPLRGPRPLPEDVKSLNTPSVHTSSLHAPSLHESLNGHPGDDLVFRKPLNTNPTQTSLLTSSTALHRDLNAILVSNHARFVSNTLTAPTSSTYTSSAEVDESDSSIVEEIPTSEYLDENELNLSELGSFAHKQLMKKTSSDSIASSNFTSISQRPVNPRYYERNAETNKNFSTQVSVHPFRAQTSSKRTKEQKLKEMRKKLSTGDF